jgi:hypothetical protein
MHEVLDAISLELARRIATRLRARPELIEVAHRNLDRWSDLHKDSPALLRCDREWQEILKRPLNEVLDLLCAETDEGQRLRQNDPFVGILSDDGVLAVKRDFRRRETARA